MKGVTAMYKETYVWKFTVARFSAFSATPIVETFEYVGTYDMACIKAGYINKSAYAYVIDFEAVKEL